MRIFASALVLGLGLLPLSAGAQFDLGNSDPFTISVSPDHPVPGGTATLSFLSSTLDLAGATLTVSIAGKEIYTGSVHDVQVTLGPAGRVTTVLARIAVRGTIYSQSASIVPQDIVLIAEPSGSIPALYPGKSGIPAGGTVRVVAVANVRSPGGAALSPASLSYAWTVDGTQIANSSGIGKSALMVAAPLPYRSRIVSVSVADASGTVSGGASLTISPVDPVVRIYENDPLLGIRFDRALSGTFSIGGAEESLYAAPFSLPAAGSLIEWFVDGNSVQTGSAITMRPAGSGAGKAQVSVVASAGDAKATGNLQLTFGAKSSSGFFGL